MAFAHTNPAKFALTLLACLGLWAAKADAMDVAVPACPLQAGGKVLPLYESYAGQRHLTAVLDHSEYDMALVLLDMPNARMVVVDLSNAPGGVNDQDTFVQAGLERLRTLARNPFQPSVKRIAWRMSQAGYDSSVEPLSATIFECVEANI